MPRGGKGGGGKRENGVQVGSGGGRPGHWQPPASFLIPTMIVTHPSPSPGRIRTVPTCARSHRFGFRVDLG
eukprot:1577661-Rhodomonas_salina.1